MWWSCQSRSPAWQESSSAHADLEMLEKEEHFQPAFISLEGKEKRIECIRTDSGSDKAPCYDEVQFSWTRRHMEKPTVVQLVTSRQSGRSNLNCVELQNGCEVKARCGLFIPSTLNGSNLNENGKIDNNRLCKNLSDAIEVYISRVHGASCGDAQIFHYKGADSSKYQSLRDNLLVFIRGNKAEKSELKRNYPDDYEYISAVFEVRSRHLNKNVPLRYVFHLVCCYDKKCPHPICRGEDPPLSTLCWYKGGPPITYIPLPAPDPQRPYGSQSCSNCKNECAGHFLPPKDLIDAYIKGEVVVQHKEHPTEVLKAHFQKYGTVQELSRKCLLPASGVSGKYFYLEILFIVCCEC